MKEKYNNRRNEHLHGVKSKKEDLFEMTRKENTRKIKIQY